VSNNLRAMKKCLFYVGTDRESIVLHTHMYIASIKGARQTHHSMYVQALVCENAIYLYPVCTYPCMFKMLYESNYLLKIMCVSIKMLNI
jgi:hypothetical protein